jgi:hypothetical protein
MVEEKEIKVWRIKKDKMGKTYLSRPFYCKVPKNIRYWKGLASRFPEQYRVAELEWQSA